MSLIRPRAERRSRATTEFSGERPLAELRPGTTAKIVAVDSAEAATARRLGELGFVPDGEVTVLRRAPLGDPVIFRVAEYEVALRRSQSAAIRVAPLS